MRDESKSRQELDWRTARKRCEWVGKELMRRQE
jgi:hypothetical protein